MIKTLWVILFGVLLCDFSIAQNTCSEQSLCNIVNSIKRIDFKKEHVLIKKKYGSFDFALFKPIPAKVKSADYFEIGYDADKKIAEITYFGKSKFATNYKLLVYDFAQYRVLILQHFTADQFLFTPIAIVMFKEASEENYAINVARRFGGEGACCGSSYYSSFPIKEIENISSVMALDTNLYPRQIVQMAALQIVISSNIFYEKENQFKVKNELTGFFLSSVSHSDLKVDPEKMTLSQIVRTSQVPPDFAVELNPDLHGFDEAPLWLFGGSYDYKKCDP